MQKRPFRGVKRPFHARFRVAACQFVPFRAQNCLFWLSFEEKITPMPECVGKIYINKTAQSPSSKVNTPIIGPTKCPKPLNLKRSAESKPQQPATYQPTPTPWVQNHPKSESRGGRAGFRDLWILGFKDGKQKRGHRTWSPKAHLFATRRV
jgi:hypothetical protein